MQYRVPKETHYFVGAASTAALGFANVLIMTQILSVESMGQYALFLSILFFAVMIGTSWASETYIRYSTEALLNGKYVNTSEPHVLKAIVVLLGVSFISLLYACFGNTLATYINIDLGYVYILILSCVVQSLLTWQQCYYRILENHVRSAYLMTAQRFLLLFVLLMYWYLDVNSFELVLLAFMVCGATVCLFSFVPFTIPFSKLKALKGADAKKYLQHAQPYFLGVLCVYFVNYIDIVILGIFRSKDEVGVYSVMYSGYNAILLLAISLQTILVSKVIRKKHFEEEKVLGWYRGIVIKCLLLSVLFLSLVMFFASNIIEAVLPAEYYYGVNSFTILVASVFFYLVAMFANPLFTAYDCTRYFLYIAFTKAVCNGVFGLVLVPMHGISGAAYGTFLSLVVAAALAVYFVFSNINRFRYVADGTPV